MKKEKFPAKLLIFISLFNCLLMNKMVQSSLLFLGFYALEGHLSFSEAFPELKGFCCFIIFSLYHQVFPVLPRCSCFMIFSQHHQVFSVVSGFSTITRFSWFNDNHFSCFIRYFQFYHDFPVLSGFYCCLIFLLYPQVLPVVSYFQYYHLPVRHQNLLDQVRHPCRFYPD